MNKSLFLTFLITFFFNLVYGQQEIKENIELTSKILYAPSQHMNALKPGLKFGFELPRTHDASLIVWGGLSHSDLYLFNDVVRESFFNYQKMVGFHAAIEQKKYLNPRHSVKGPRSYVSLSVGLDKIMENRSERVVRQGGAYFQSIDFKRKELSFPLIAHFGKKIFNIRSVQVDGSVGMGVRYFRLKNNLPEDATFQRFGLFRNSGDFIDGNFARFAFQMGIYISIPTTKRIVSIIGPNSNTEKPDNSLLK